MVVKLNTLAVFSISPDESITVYVPDAEYKYNRYYKPTDNLNQFDEITVVYRENSKSHVIKMGAIDHALAALYCRLIALSENKCVLPEDLKKGELGRLCNEDTYRPRSSELIIEEDVFSDYYLWSVSELTETYAYNHAGKMYLEIGPTYPWLFRDPKLEELFVSFEEFMKTYQLIALIELAPVQVQEWIQQCKKVRLMYEDEFGNPID
jgi:hypothetical protein